MKALLLSSLILLSSLCTAQTYDVCVYGGTSAGVMAAVTAKRAGKSVVLIEPGKHLGGLSSGGLGATDIGNKFAVTGLARDFYRRIGKHYGRLEQWTFEPHVAEKLFEQYIKEAGVPVLRNYRIVTIGRKRNQITNIQVEDTGFPASLNANGMPTGPDWQLKTVIAKVFLDCSYEGDLMAQTGVWSTIGREDNTRYGETWNGVQLLDKHQFPDGVDPYKIPGKPESGLIYGISDAKLKPNGTGDMAVQAYNYRMCLTDNPANRVPITRPDDYDSTKYELVLRQIAASKKVPDVLTWNLMHFVMMPNRKTDINNCGGFSTDMIGANFDYPNADHKRRAEIIKAHESYTKGLFYFIGHDPRMPKHLRDEMLQWGYPKDEYVDNGHFSHQLYIREARRMVGEYVMTQANCEGKTTVTDGVGMAAYTMDSHNCQRVVVEKDGKMMVKNEGDVQVGGFPPYPVSYRSLVPKKSECSNLLVPVCLSASHIAYGSIRMEPVFMVLAQSAALAACHAIDEGVPVQEIDIKKLQARLTNDPLLDGRAPERLIDNDDTESVTTTGTWERLKTGGKYGTSLLLAPAGQKAAVTFRAKNLKPGRYTVYVYNPLWQGGGGNPDQIGVQRGKQARVTVRLTTEPRYSALVINQQQQNNDWISLGDHTLGSSASLTIDAGNALAPVVADAVLFVPVK
ncbi:MAG: FAD-dependent oxidoreductase [Cytophagales bacterium]|nr:MAG: FAD-dependent oxidoreductase [Cytophagales bacterium]